ncbi:hypothetical protein HCO69_20410 [Pantoea sp. LS15]|uniref:DUF6945 domain-containing protein n=1 Tax=Enterobacterales TaxID=91347 RepID=UPI000E0F1C3A|nr:MULTISPECIES: hypothetical protein [Enterobacterales]NJQ21971.1 hypothetical protein [Pantoea sp. LS15]NKF48567.1 hypothetical protein [Pantoea sp. LS15]RDK12790.1 hypothetical protein CEJ32_20905 [Enterobacter sp. 9-2]
MTETVETNVIKEPSRIIPKRLDARTMAVKSTGEVIRVTNDHRIIYAYLEDQFRGLTNPKNIAAGRSTGHFYDSDENLAIKNDVSKSTFKKVKKDLKALGLIDWKTPKAKKSGHACEYFVKQLIDIAHNLEFIYQELPNGQPSYDHVRVSGLKTKKTKKAAQPKIEEREDGVQKQEHEQQSPGMSPTAIYSESKPVQQADSVASASAEDDPEQRSGFSQPASDSSDDVSAHDAVNGGNVIPVPKVKKQESPEIADLDSLKCWRENGPGDFGFMEYGKEHGETDVDRIAALIDQHYFEALNQITIFDENRVVTEEFINGLSRGEAPKRNDDGTLKKYGFAYAMAQAYQAHREGKSEEEIQRSIPVWIEAALPEYIPVHLLPKSEPV